MTSRAPYDFAEARDAAAAASRAQAGAEDFMVDCAREAAKAEERYRVELAKEIVRQHNEDGVAWSVAPDLARGNTRVARLRHDRDIAEGVREAAAQASWRRAADRRDTSRFIDWSMRRDLAEGAGLVPLVHEAVLNRHQESIVEGRRS